MRLTPFRATASATLLFSLLLSAAAFAQEAPRAKNVILLIADGRGYNHIRATDFYEHGEVGKQVYEQTFTSLFMSTYSASGAKGYDPQKAWSDPDYIRHGATDSAAAATAMATGVKTYNGAIGVGPDKQPVPSVVDRAEELGKATGVITSVMFSHATPAGFVAHEGGRGRYEDIARDMLVDSKVDVIMGTGNPWFDASGKFVAAVDDKGAITTPQNYSYVGGVDLWLQLLTGTLGGDADADGQPDLWTPVMSRAEFQELTDGETPERVLGVAQAASSLQVERPGSPEEAPGTTPFTENVPTLAEMTRAAINVLDNDPDGFFLMVEGGAVD